ncbi:MAG: hypothetical protein IPG76_12925 [Acidobacteria bacterium]|nr:hypothetical protein [Acidobacteriota bacterium]
MIKYLFGRKSSILLGVAIILTLVTGALNYPVSGQTQGRIVRVVNTQAVAGQNVVIPVELLSLGNENALGFSLEFNPAILTSPAVAPGASAAGASLNANLVNVANGKIGIALAFPAGQTFSAGVRQIVNITFSVPANASSGSTSILFSDQPVFREVVDVDANTLTATFTVGTVNVVQPNSLPVLTSLNPTFTIVGTQGIILSINGQNFLGNSVARWNGTDRVTTFVSASQLTMAVPAADLAATGSASVTVFNPAPIGGLSNPLTFSINNPAPVITGLTPSSVLLGTGDTSVVITGNNFVAASKVQWNGLDRPSNYVNSTQLSFVIPAADLVNAGTATITVLNPGPGGGAANATFSVNNTVPQISSINPLSTATGSADLILTVYGSNFIAASKVRKNGSERSTTFVSNTQLTAVIPASDLAVGGTISITVFNPAPGGGISNALDFFVSNPVPALTSVSPTSALAGSGLQTLTLIGTGFQSVSKAQWNGSDRITAYISSTQLTVTLPASDLNSGGVGMITVVNPNPGGGTSNALSFTINNPLPVILSLNPVSVQAGSPDLTVTINGTGFTNSSKVRWNSNDRATTFANSTQLTFTASSADLASAGTAILTVFNPLPGGGLSGPANFVVNQPPNPVPSISGISPSTVNAGSGGFIMTVNGSNFVAGSKVFLNGNERATIFVSGTQLTANIPAVDIANPGTANITVINPAPGGGTSNAIGLNIIQPNPAPSITSINPGMVIAGGTQIALKVTGANFINQSVIRWNDIDRNTVYVSSTELSTTISPQDIALQGSAGVKVFNPAPGGGVSNELRFVIAGPISNVSAASYFGDELAIESIVATYGTNLATGLENANTVPLPTTLAGSTVLIKDSAGLQRLASLFFSSPTQMNYLIPQGTVTGTATVIITSGSNQVSAGSVRIVNVAPGLFSADASGNGLAAANALRVKMNGEQITENVANFDEAKKVFVATPIDLGPENEQVFLVLYGTGFRYRSSLSAVSSTIGGAASEVTFAGASPDYIGLDQCNIRIPRSLAGRGDVEVILFVDGKMSNKVKVNIK